MESIQSTLTEGISVFRDAISRTRSKRDGWLGLRLETGLFLFLLGLIFFVRVADLKYNTLFVDEAIYATIGEDALSGVFTQSATTWMYGSYLYPILATVTDHFAGVIGLRALSAVLSTIAAALVFLTTLRLFGRESALWALLIFGLTGGSISLGQLAVYDILSVCGLALALYCLTTAALKTEAKVDYYLLAAAIAFSLSVLSKYFALLYLPALTFIAFPLNVFRGQSIRPLFTKFLGPVVLILGIYGWRYYSDIVALFNYNGGIYSFQPSTRWMIARVIWDEIGAATLMALAGTFFLPRMSFDKIHFRDRWTILLAAMLVPLLILSMLAAPIYHLLNENIGSMWKHLVYSLIFLSPLAGRGFAFIVSWCHLRRERWASLYPLAGVAVTILGLAWFIDHSLDQNWWIKHSWPNVTGVVEYLRSQGLTKDDQVLAEGSQIYEYYFDFGVEDRKTWSNTWYLEYKGLQGIDAMVSAIQDHEFDFVVLDDYYNPGATQDLVGALETAGYTLGYEETQTLSSNDNIYLRVFVYRTTGEK